MDRGPQPQRERTRLALHRKLDRSLSLRSLLKTMAKLAFHCLLSRFPSLRRTVENKTIPLEQNIFLPRLLVEIWFVGSVSCIPNVHKSAKQIQNIPGVP